MMKFHEFYQQREEVIVEQTAPPDIQALIQAQSGLSWAITRVTNQVLKRDLWRIMTQFNKSFNQTLVKHGQVAPAVRQPGQATVAV